MTNPFAQTVIRASAGTGKTFQLSNRFLSLLDAGVAPEQILATTFTRKAAGEILERVLLRLAAAALDDERRRQLASDLAAAALDAPRCLVLLMTVVQSLHRLRISTLDSFFGQIARCFSFELDLPAGWRIVDDSRDAQLRRAAVEMTLRASPDELETLVHLLAKGESVRGVSAMVSETINSLYDLYLESEPAAWSWTPPAPPLTDVTLAGVLDDMRQLEFPHRRMATARDADYDQALAGDWDKFIDGGLAARIIDDDPTYYKQPIPGEAVAVYRKLIDHARAELVRRVALQTRATYELVDRFDAMYRELKRQSRAVRFEDITARLAHRFADAPADARLAHRLDGRIEHLLLDEFQDTSPVQWRVLLPIARRVTEPGGRRSFFCVGDVKQAIYGWRGGVAEIFDAVDRQLPGLSVQTLAHTYRLAPPVVATVNRVFQRIGRHPHLDRYEPAVRRFMRKFPEHTAAHTDRPGYTCLVTGPPGTESNDAALLDFAADRIVEIHRQAPCKSIGVLVRKNRTVAAMISSLRARDVRASEEGGNPLTDSCAVNVILSLLRLADHPSDSVARFHVAHSALAPEWVPSSESGTHEFHKLSGSVRRQLLAHGYGRSILGWAQALAPSCDRRERTRLEQLVDLAYAYQPDATLRASDFVDRVQRQRTSDPTAAPVRVMTVHQAKGLEFDSVVLPDLAVGLVGQPDSFVVRRQGDGQRVDRVCRYVNQATQKLLPPDVRRMFDTSLDQSVDESLSVLYVALTRAIHTLHLVIAPSAANERSIPKTYAGLLRAALVEARGPVAANQVLFEAGDPDSITSLGMADDPVGSVAAGAAARVTRRPRFAAHEARSGAPLRRLRRTAPSELEGGRRRSVAALAKLDNQPAMLRGTLFHAWFEQIRWLEEGTPSDEQLMGVGQRVLGGTTELDLARQMAQFRAAIGEPEIADVLSRVRYESGTGPAVSECVAQALRHPAASLVVENERAFAVTDGERLVTGSIDRLVTVRHQQTIVAAEIIDFKTDRVVGDADRRSKSKHYEPQMEEYRWAVARLYELDSKRIATRLVFVASSAEPVEV